MCYIPVVAPFPVWKSQGKKLFANTQTNVKCLTHRITNLSGQPVFKQLWRTLAAFYS